jgi:hypothetical protein
MIHKSFSYAAVIALTVGLVRSVSAQDDHWNGTPGNTAWNVGSNWSLGTPPPNGNGGYVGNDFLDAANGDSVITITPGDVESPGVSTDNSPEVFNTVYGPEWGVTLNVYGTLNFDWLLFPVQNNPAVGVRSYVNMYTNSVITCAGANGAGGGALGIGDSWFYTDAPYVTMNLYGNAQYNSPGGAGLWLGGHLNVYDTATFFVNGYVNMDTAYDQSDGTRSLVLGGGTLILPESALTSGSPNTVYDWIGRGILRAYGKGFDTNDLVISDQGTNAVVTPVPLGGALQRVYFLPLLQTNVNVGTFQQAALVGDYPSVSGVLLSSSEPGLSPSSFASPLYVSSNPSVATVDVNGLVTAVGVGKATLTATVGAFASTNSVVVTVSPVVPGLAHRYSFASDASDSVGGANGTLNGDATIAGGQLVLSGNQGSSVSLPAGILSGVNQVTLEAWVTFPSTINAYANLFAFGNTELGSPLSATYGDGENYITFSPHTGGLTTQANFGQGDPGFDGEWDASANQVLDNMTNAHVVVVFNPYAGSEAIYVNGVMITSQSMFNNLIDPVACVGPTYNTNSILAYVLGADPLNYIGQSLYTGDPGLLANIDEVRIYTNVLTSAQIAADTALGPNQLIGTSTNVTAAAVMTNGNLVIKWPTTSALVSLMSSPQLGAGASWTPVAGGLTTDGSGNYQMNIPMTGAARFFRLQQ